MKTTLELPDALVRRVKTRAVERDQRLKDTFAELLELALNLSAPTARVPVLPKPVRLRGKGGLSPAQIEKAIADGRD